MVPGPSCETILNTIGTCSTVHRMPYPRRCSATESWRVLALSLYQIFQVCEVLWHTCKHDRSMCAHEQCALPGGWI